MKRILFLTLILTVLLSACSSSGNEIPPTEAIPSTNTPIPPTPTQTPLPTQTPTETPVPTPTPDLRTMLDGPKSFVLITDDLIPEGNYYISQNKGTISNEMIVYYFTQQLGTDTAGLVDLYLQETNRLDGYSQVWTRGNWAFEGPLYIANEIAVFKNVRGAQLEVTKYKPMLINAMDGRVPSHEEIQIGDTTRIYIDTVVANGQEADIILVEFSYQNAVIDIGCWGEKGKYTLDDVVTIAQNVFARLQELPLEE